MPYIGSEPNTGLFVELDSLTASATADYTLQLNGANYFPETVNNLLVSINGVIQGSSTMALNGSTLTVGATLSSSDVIDFVRVFGNVGSISTPTDGSVSTNKLGNLSVTNAKIANSTVDLTSKVTGVLPAANGGTAIDIIANNTTGVSNAANIEIDLSTDTNYAYQEINLYDVYFASAQDGTIYLRTTGGSYRNGGGSYHWGVTERVYGVSTDGTGSPSGGDTKIRPNWYSFGDASTETTVLTIKLYNVGDAGEYTTIGGQRYGTTNSNLPVIGDYMGRVLTKESNDKLKFMPASGNMYVGGYTHYGYRRT